jgi:hypothetical protein
MTVVGMCVIMDAARFVVENMRTNDKYEGKWKKPVLVMMPHLLCYQKTNAGSENKYRYEAVMMAPVPVP